jgi:hypothetical protein
MALEAEAIIVTALRLGSREKRAEKKLLPRHSRSVNAVMKNFTSLRGCDFEKDVIVSGAGLMLTGEKSEPTKCCNMSVQVDGRKPAVRRLFSGRAHCMICMTLSLLLEPEICECGANGVHLQAHCLFVCLYPLTPKQASTTLHHCVQLRKLLAKSYVSQVNRRGMWCMTLAGLS